MLRIRYNKSMKGIWSVKQAAEQLGISEQRVRKLLADGRIKGRKLDGTWLVLSLTFTRKKKRKKEEGS